VTTFVVDRSPADYRMLANQIRDANLLACRSGAYVAKMALTAAGLGAGWLALFVVGNSWVALAIAPVLGFFSTQVVFFGHDAGHQQIFRSRRANRMVGLIAGDALTGVSFGWWVPKHAAHHAHPNVVDRDPDIGVGGVALASTAEIAGSRRSAGRLLARYQAWVFFPLLALEGLGLHISGVSFLVRRRDRSAALEGVILGLHAIAYLTFVFRVLSPLRGVAFIAVQQGLFGLYLGCTFAPNHKGMPIYNDDSGLGFLQGQISVSRNVKGGRFTAFIFGGLNYQIEHHLFPTMPRPNLAKAQRIVRSFCATQDIPYNEDTLVGSYRQALGYLNRVSK
jgi:fatty acid desaturase